jgi:uncharacterized membrane protein YdjX (TVP38/TMEM64 family)
MTMLGLLAGLAAVFVLWGPTTWDLLTDQDRFREWIESYGTYAAFVFMAAQAVQVILFFIPGEVTQMAGGYIFGLWAGLLLSYIGITLGSLAAFALARLFGHAVLDLLGGREALRRFDWLVYGRAGLWPMFVLFLIPGIPKDLLCYVAGLTSMRLGAFLLLSTVARFPGVLLSSLFGAGLAERNWLSVALTAALTGAALAVGYLLRGRIERFQQRYRARAHARDRDPRR